MLLMVPRKVLAMLLMVPRKVLVMLLLMVCHWSLSSGHSDRVPAVDGGPVGEVEDDEENGEDAEEDEISSGEPVRPAVTHRTIQVLRVTGYNLPAPPGPRLARPVNPPPPPLPFLKDPFGARSPPRTFLSFSLSRMTVYSSSAPNTKMMQAITQHSIAVRPSALTDRLNIARPKSSCFRRIRTEYFRILDYFKQFSSLSLLSERMKRKRKSSSLSLSEGN